MSRGIAIATLSTTLAACSSPTDIRFALDEQTDAVVVASAQGNTIRVEAVDPDAERSWRTNFLREGATEVAVLQYERTLEELDMRPGMLDRVIDDAIPSQLLPDADRIDLRILDVADDGTWTRVDSLPPSMVSFRFKRTTAQACLEGGGCYADGRCVTPCPMPPEPEPPQDALLPSLACPDGWTSVPPEGPDDIATCNPFPPVGILERCSRGEHHLPGTAGCAPLGNECPTGAFPDDAPVDAVYVATNGSGDGTRTRPFGSVSDAVRDVSPGGTIVVGAGTYRETLLVNKPVTIRGACAARTLVGESNALVSVTVTATATIRDIAFVGQTALSVDGGDVTFDGVHFDGTRFTGLIVLSGRALGRGVHVSTAQTGLRAEGGPIELEDVTIVDARGSAITTVGSWPMTLTNFAVDGTGSSAIVVGQNGSIVLNQGIVRGFNFRGIQYFGSGEATLTDVIFRDSLSNAVPIAYVEEGASLTGTRVIIDNMNGAGLSVAGGTAALTDSAVRHTRSQIATGFYGTGVEVSEGGLVTLTRVHVYESRGVGVLAVGSGTRAVLEDVVIADTRGWLADGERGTALNGFEESSIEITRVKLVRAHGFGVVAELSASISGTDLTVVDTLPRDANDAYGRGAELSSGGKMNVTRALFSGNRSVAVFALDPETSVMLTDVVMTRTTESTCFMFSCNAGLADGLTVILSAEAIVDRFAIVDNGQYGLRIANDPELTLKNGRIAGNAVGVQSVTEGFDFARIADGVSIVDNDTPFSVLAQ